MQWNGSGIIQDKIDVWQRIQQLSGMSPLFGKNRRYRMSSFKALTARASQTDVKRDAAIWNTRAMNHLTKTWVINAQHSVIGVISSPRRMTHVNKQYIADCSATGID